MTRLCPTITMRAAYVAVVIVGSVALLAAQKVSNPAVAAVDVASIRRNTEAEAQRAAFPPNQPVAPGRLLVMPGGTLRADGISLVELIREGYGYVNRPSNDVSGGPGWVTSDRYTVVIKADRTEFGPAQPWGLLPQDAAAMVRQFLADRFKLQVHVEQRDRVIYDMVLDRTDGRLGPGLTKADNSCLGIYAPPGPGQRCHFILGGGQGFQTGNITMRELATILGVFPAVNAQIVDKTGLAGVWNVKMTRFIGGAVSAAPDAANDDRPTMVVALREMLGLTLERSRGPVDVIVIDRAERPTDN